MTVQKIFTEFSASITQAKDNPNRVLEEAGGAPVVVLANNTPRYYMVPPEMYELMIEALAAQSAVVNIENTSEGNFNPTRVRLHEIAENCAKYLVEGKPSKREDFKEK